MRVAMRVLVLLAVFAGAGWVAARGVMRHGASHAARGVAPEPEVRLAAEMAGLFAGGAAALVMGIAMVWMRDKP